jgi:hypothetical protein
MDFQPQWIGYLSALATPAIALLTGLIAYRQWKTGQDKLKLDLFDRRFALYEKARELLARRATSGKLEGGDVVEFIRGTRSSKWLFNQQIAAYFEKEIGERGLELETLISELEGLPAGAERSKNVEKQRAIKDWFDAQFEALDDKLSKFLTLSH